MHILLYVSAAIAALSLALIAVFVFLVLKNTKQTMNSLSDTVQRVETKLNGITEQSAQLMEKTNRIAEDVETKVQSLDQLTKSARNFGQTTEHLNESFASLSQQIATPPKKLRPLMEKATALTEAAARIYYRLKKEKEVAQQKAARQSTGASSQSASVPQLEYHSRE